MPPKRKTHTEFVEQIRNLPLTAIGTYECAKNKVLFKCSIDGNEWAAAPNDILRGRGCPLCHASRRKQNAILADHGEWLEIDVSTRKHPAAVMKINKADWEAVSGLGHTRVYSFGAGNTSYAGCKSRGINDPRKSYLVHRLVLNTDLDVDHINHDGLDNRRENLRECTQSQNAMNMMTRKKSASGMRGVSWCKRDKKWLARIRVFGKNIHLGRHESFETAIAVRKAAEKKYFGRFYQEKNDV